MQKLNIAIEPIRCNGRWTTGLASLLQKNPVRSIFASSTLSKDTQYLTFLIDYSPKTTPLFAYPAKKIIPIPRIPSTLLPPQPQDVHTLKLPTPILDDLAINSDSSFVHH